MTVHPPSDHDLLAGGVEDLVTENAAAARRLGRLVEFHRRCGHRVVPEGHFGLTPVQETVVEVGELWGLSPGRVRSELQRARVLCETFPDVWQLCLDGALDTYRAGLVADAATGSLPEAAWPELADRIGPWLRARRRPPGGDTDLPDLVVCTVKQLRNKLTYETARLRPRDADERFRRAYDDRRATAHTQPLDGSAGDGTGALVLTSSVDRIQLADHRLTLAAKAVRASGDGRTLEQLRTDLALGLILGTTRIAPDGDASVPGDWIVEVPAAAFARPVINVTVPIQTLMGVSDDPGCLSGGTVVPATLARMSPVSPGRRGTGCSPTRPGAASRCRRGPTPPPRRSGTTWSHAGPPASGPAATGRPPTASSTTGCPSRPARPATSTCSPPASATTRPSTPTGSGWVATGRAGRRCGPALVSST